MVEHIGAQHIFDLVRQLQWDFTEQPRENHGHRGKEKVGRQQLGEVSLIQCFFGQPVDHLSHDRRNNLQAVGNEVAA